MLTPGEDIWLPIRAYYRAIGNRETLANRSETVCSSLDTLPMAHHSRMHERNS